MNCRRYGMRTRAISRSIIGILLIFLFFAGAIIASSAVAAAAQSGITKKIRIVLPSEPDTLDLMSTKMPGVSGPIAENITERLIGISTDRKLIPTGLATSWKISPDRKEVDFTLRKGVKFHNGDPFTTKDVQFSHERGFKNSTAYQRSMRYLENITILDDYRVRFRFILT
jgi:peptide/nickel transport system substrate-binding protein